MEEPPLPLLRKPTSKDLTLKQTADSKITQLHDLIQGYVNTCNRRKIDDALPAVQKLRKEIDTLNGEVERIKGEDASEEYLGHLHEARRVMTEDLKVLAKRVEAAKLAAKRIKINKAELQEELRKNEQTLNQLIKHQHSRKTQLPNLSKSSSASSRHDDKQNFFNSLNYLRLREINRLLELHSADPLVDELEDCLTRGDHGASVKRVFKNFSINAYFDEFLRGKEVRRVLEKMEQQ